MTLAYTYSDVMMSRRHDLVKTVKTSVYEDVMLFRPGVIKTFCTNKN